MTTSDLDPDALADWADKKAREVADNNRLICGPCGAPLPSPECGHPELGVIGCCIAAGDSNIEAAIAAALREAEQRGQESMRERAAERLDRMKVAAEKCAASFSGLKAKGCESFARHEANCYDLAAANIRATATELRDLTAREPGVTGKGEGEK